MQNPKWIIEHDIFAEFIDPFIATLKRMGVEYKVVKFGTSYETAINIYNTSDCVVLYGSFQFAKVAAQKGWYPDVVNLFPEFSCTRYYPLFGDNLLNSEYVMLPFGELNRRKDWLLNNLGESGYLFVRPDSAIKSFTGQMINKQEWVKNVRLIGFYDVEPHELIVVARPIRLKREWRTVVVDNKIVAATQYRDGQDMKRLEGAPEEVLAYGQQLLDSISFNPNAIWTLDICETESNALKVMEVGTFSCAALYSCDPESVITAVNGAVARDYLGVVDADFAIRDE